VERTEALEVPDRPAGAVAPDLAPAQHRPIGSVVIAAYEEAAVIGRCLRHLLAGLGDGVEVLVVPNGCTDATAAVARRFPVQVLERTEASKSRALREGEERLTAFPRIYLDADVIMAGEAARTVIEHLRRPGALAARPPFLYDTTGAVWPVRCYYRARQRLPSLTTHLWGAGVYALSSEGRSRFSTFPDVVGDDLYVDQLFAPGEVEILDVPPVRVLTPRSCRALLQVLRRQNKGKRGLASMENAQPTARVAAELVLLLRSRPASAVDVVVFTVFAVLSRSRRRGTSIRWERDLSSRRS
jgi:hypothetical protein